ncbi:MAG: hypothetical protein JWP97_1895 [Labilithrix sp.]|nr:hypothetical protein [Labilithrix sp.]
MRSTIVAAVVLTFASLVAVPAFAAPAQSSAPAKSQRAEGDKGQKHFPMPAAEFKAKVEHRMQKARAHLEERVAKLDANEAKEARAKFEAVAANVNAEVAKACADGTVTADEAKAVRAANPHHGKHARHGKK